MADAVVAAMDLEVAAERDVLQVAHCADVPDEDLKRFLLDSLRTIREALATHYDAEGGTYENLELAALLRAAAGERLLPTSTTH